MAVCKLVSSKSHSRLFGAITFTLSIIIAALLGWNLYVLHTGATPSVVRCLRRFTTTSRRWWDKPVSFFVSRPFSTYLDIRSAFLVWRILVFLSWSPFVRSSRCKVAWGILYSNLFHEFSFQAVSGFTAAVTRLTATMSIRRETAFVESATRVIANGHRQGKLITTNYAQHSRSASIRASCETIKRHGPTKQNIILWKVSDATSGGIIAPIDENRAASSSPMHIAEPCAPQQKSLLRYTLM